MQAEAPIVLADLIHGASEEALQRKPQADKWSVSEILAHLADDEIATSWRYRQMIESSGCALAGFDQDQWARMGRYASRGARESLELFRLLREANLCLLQGLTEEEWQRHGIHGERGKITVQDLARHMAGHDRNHVEQIRTILEKQ